MDLNCDTNSGNMQAIIISAQPASRSPCEISAIGHITIPSLLCIFFQDEPNAFRFDTIVDNAGNGFIPSIIGGVVDPFVGPALAATSAKSAIVGTAVGDAVGAGVTAAAVILPPVVIAGSVGYCVGSWIETTIEDNFSLW